ncbi:MAG: hypothetical protein AB9842_08160 [Bacteroidales bacterium]
MIHWLTKMFSSDKSVSSKRVFGAFGFTAMVVKVLLMNDPDLVLWVLGISASMLGLETLVNGFKKSES